MMKAKGTNINVFVDCQTLYHSLKNDEISLVLSVLLLSKNKNDFKI